MGLGEFFKDRLEYRRVFRFGGLVGWVRGFFGWSEAKGVRWVVWLIGFCDGCTYVG